ncbi:hypothetical protein HYO62_00250 [Aerococcaceae bacterium DSM 111022]|nr:hypothetical protein [Aerococcaceae bacterium DSM 111022]
MENYFDKKTVKILTKIYKSKDGLKRNEIETILQDEFSIFLLDRLVNDGYLIGKDNSGNHFSKVEYPSHSSWEDRYYSTPQTNKFIEEKTNKSRLFWFPYLITTFIALTNLIITIINFFK